jgi:hypothetical protein
LDNYSTASAAALVKSGRRVSFATGILRGLWTFVRTYILQRGFLDGHQGFLLAVANAEGTYYRYMKVWLAQRGAINPVVLSAPLGPPLQGADPIGVETETAEPVAPVDRR